MNEVVDEGTRLWDQITQEGILSLTFSDIIWLVGSITLLILALKVARKVWKVLLTLAAIVALVLWLLGQASLTL